MNNMKKWFLFLMAAGLLLVAACTFVPGIDLGVDFDYYGGEFHVRPNASVGITGHP